MSEDNSKICSRCKIQKLFKDFNNCKTGKLGLHNHCRVCQKEVRRNWYKQNRESEIKKASEYSKSEIAKEQRKKVYLQNKDVILAVNRKRRSTPHARKMANKARNKRRKENLSFRISTNLRGRIRVALKGICKSDSTLELLGCDLEFFKKYLENQFTDGMSWENYGKQGWHIDHIKPCAKFDLTNVEQQKICFHYSNLQPLWWKENISKGSKYE